MQLDLERVVQRHNKWVVGSGEDFALSENTLHFIPNNHLVLWKHFHGVRFTGFVVLHEEHTPHIPFPNEFDLLEILGTGHSRFCGLLCALIGVSLFLAFG
jgi:hypothetical protein